MWEVVQGFGAMVGLITGMFVLWERLTRETPFAYVVAKNYTLAHRTAYLRLKNRSERPILVFFLASRENNRLVPAPDEDDALLTIVSGTEMTVAMDGGETKDFPLGEPPNIDDVAPDNQLVCEFRWSFAQPIWYQRFRRVSISIPKGRYDALVEGKQIVFDDDPNRIERSRRLGV